MRANAIQPEIMTKNGAWLKNAYFISDRNHKSTKDKTFVQEFLLCVDIDGVKKIIDKTSIHFNSEATDAIIAVDGVDVNLLEHLMANGEFVLENVKSFGMPSYDELKDYFNNEFDDLTFVENPFTWFYKLWGLKNINFPNSGIECFGNFEFL